MQVPRLQSSTQVVLLSTFSPNMLGKKKATLGWTPISLDDVISILEDVDGEHLSHISQQAICNVLSSKLQDSSRFFVERNHAPYFLDEDDFIIHVQYLGPVIGENSVSIPKGGALFFWWVQPLTQVGSLRTKDGHKLHIYEGV